MTFLQLRHAFTQQLSNYSASEAQALFFRLMLEMGQISQAQFFMMEYEEVPFALWEKIQQAQSELLKNKPLQYILGKADFLGLSLQVNENVLIPRPETEELVLWVLQEASHNEKLKILDIGTGSGCIAIALAKNLPNAQLYALDLSAQALSLAKKNAETHGVSINFIEGNILETSDLGEDFDIIISNPPYVRHSEKQQIHLNVLDYEPHLALFVPDENPLVFYEKIAQLAQKNLKKQGLIFFEINQYLPQEMLKMMENYHFFPTLHLDLQGNPRMIKGVKKS